MQLIRAFLLLLPFITSGLSQDMDRNLTLPKASRMDSRWHDAIARSRELFDVVEGPTNMTDLSFLPVLLQRTKTKTVSNGVASMFQLQNAMMFVGGYLENMRWSIDKDQAISTG